MPEAEDFVKCFNLNHKLPLEKFIFGPCGIFLMSHNPLHTACDSFSDVMDTTLSAEMGEAGMSSIRM